MRLSLSDVEIGATYRATETGATFDALAVGDNAVFVRWTHKDLGADVGMEGIVRAEYLHQYEKVWVPPVLPERWIMIYAPSSRYPEGMTASLRTPPALPAYTPHGRPLAVVHVRPNEVELHYFNSDGTLRDG